MNYQAPLAFLVLCIVAVNARAQYGDLPIADQNPPQMQMAPQAQDIPFRSTMDGFAPPATAVSGPRYILHDQQQEPVGETPWCDSPYRSSAWRVEFDLIPTVSHVSEDAFGDWSDNGSLALRLNFGYEGCDGFGTRLEFWGFDDTQDTFAGSTELSASTFYWDFYKRFFVQDAELLLGGGLAGAGMEYNLSDLHEHARLSSGGISVFGEGFYSLWRFAKSDLGSIGRARLALLSGEWREHGAPFVDDTDHDLLSIVELAWGLEFRRRFGVREDRYWYIDLVPEFQRWESASLPNVFDPGFQGTSINFGLAW
jgi:hypothetical protein